MRAARAPSALASLTIKLMRILARHRPHRHRDGTVALIACAVGPVVAALASLEPFEAFSTSAFSPSRVDCGSYDFHHGFKAVEQPHFACLVASRASRLDLGTTFPAAERDPRHK